MRLDLPHSEAGITPQAESQRVTSDAIPLRSLLLGFLFVALVALTACGGSVRSSADSRDDQDQGVEATSAANVTNDPAAAVRYEAPVASGADPFVEGVSLQQLDPAGEPVLGPGLYGGTGDPEVCDRELLVSSLAAQPAKAEAWAAAANIEVEELSDYISELQPAVLGADTRVTNHGFRDGRATPFQSTLGTGTAVLVDEKGNARTRCACGNPLADPTDAPAEPADDAPASSDDSADFPPNDANDNGSHNDHNHDGGSNTDGNSGTDGDSSTEQPDPSFCLVWAEVGDAMSGGPDAPGLEALENYLIDLRDGLDRLIEAAGRTPGFPESGLDDLTAYRADIAAAAAVVADGALPGPGDAALRDRVELLVAETCSGITTDGDDSSDTGSDDDPPAEGPTNADAPSANCGTMQFLLLIAAADGLGVDHAAVSEPHLAAMEAVLAGVDPGPEFEVGDLAPMIAHEAVGCAGAQAMYQLFAAEGMADAIDGTDLDPYHHGPSGLGG